MSAKLSEIKAFKIYPECFNSYPCVHNCEIFFSGSSKIVRVSLGAIFIKFFRLNLGEKAEYLGEDGHHFDIYQEEKQLPPNFLERFLK